MDLTKNLHYICSLILLLSPLLCLSNFPCEWSMENASYNLVSLQITGNSPLRYYTVTDNRSDTTLSNYTYIFNLCDNIIGDPPAHSCYNQTLRDLYQLPYGYCSGDYDSDDPCTTNLTAINITTAAYQLKQEPNVRTRDEKCWRLHNGITPPQFELINIKDPSIGFKIIYENGDWCKSQNSNREFTIYLYCADNYQNIFDEEEIIYEYPTCVYNVELFTIFGCPIQCPIKNERLCSGNGICDMDWTNHQPKCFCYYGYYGDDCSATTDIDQTVIYHNDNDKLVGWLIVVVVLLIVVLSILGYLYMRFNRIKTPDQAVKSSVQKQKKKAMKQTLITNKNEPASDQLDVLVENDVNAQGGFDQRPISTEKNDHDTQLQQE